MKQLQAFAAAAAANAEFRFRNSRSQKLFRLENFPVADCEVRVAAAENFAAGNRCPPFQKY
jgi:hypothetical protein